MSRAALSKPHVVSMTVVAVAAAFALFLLPSPRHDYGELAVAAAVAAALVACAALQPRALTAAPVLTAIAYVALAAILRDAAGGSPSGFGGLFLLPVLWTAAVASRRDLALVVLAVFAAHLVPLLAVGGEGYPTSGWRSAVVLTSVGAVAGAMVQRLIEETRAHNERLLEADRLKDQFIAVVSHELRTPLTSVAGYLEMALEDDEEPIPPRQHDHLLIVQRNVGRLMALVNQLLFLARAEAQGFQLQKTAVDVAGLLAEATETARPTAAAKEIVLAVETGPEPLPPVDGDRTLLLQLLDNLVSNAVKFTPAGGRVHLQARRAGSRIAIEVTDTGAGIPAEEVGRLFRPFVRAASATRDAVPGTGLGLAISRVIAEAHGTALEVESAPGAGSTFRFELASAAGAARTAEAVRAPAAV